MSQARFPANFPVIVVGSGAGGGMVAHQLTRAGVGVLLLEAGRDYSPATKTAMFNWPHEAPLRGEGTPDKPGGFYDATVGGGDIPGEPYTSADGTNFAWWRARMLGGRTHHWGRQVPRYGPDDFKARSNTGYEADWPVSYAEMAPWYDRTEELIGVFGPDESEAIHNSPMPPNAIRQPAPAPRASELVFAKACRVLGIPTHAHPTAILTQPLGERNACFYATNCLRGCSIGAAFDAVTGFISPARKTGRLELITEAVVHEIMTDPAGGRATGVRYVDKKTGQRRTAHAPVVVLAASAMESCRILLNSRSDSAPRGLCNSSGLVGRYLSDTIATAMFIQLPAFRGLPPHNEDGVSQPHLYAPWWLHGEAKSEAGADFPGGYKVEVDPYGGGRFGVPTMGSTVGQLLSTGKGLYGRELKAHMRRNYGSLFALRAFGGMTQNEHCYLTLDAKVRDRWGVPAPRFHWQWSDEDFRRCKHMNETLHRIARQMGAVVLEDWFEGDLRAGTLSQRPGGLNHEVGGCRMGDDPRHSVLDRHSRAWDVPNLYVADGAPFVTHAEKNPTLTIMALAMRAADDIVKRLEARDL